MKEKRFNKLRGRIKEIFGTQEAFANALGVSDTSVIHKLSGKTPWKQVEITRACELLEIDDAELCAYFFAE